MEEIIKQAERLKTMIKDKKKEIDNPALYISTLTAVDFFIENVGSEADE